MMYAELERLQSEHDAVAERLVDALSAESIESIRTLVVRALSRLNHIATAYRCEREARALDRGDPDGFTRLVSELPKARRTITV